MAGDLDIRIRTDNSIADVIAQFEATAKQIETAKKRAFRKLRTWVQRQVFRAVANAVGTSQKTIKSLSRVNAQISSREGALYVWIGTDPIKARYLGKVRWSRRMKGARVGRRLFPGTWSWGPGSKTGSAVMQRIGDYHAGSGEGIEEVRVPIHEEVEQAIESLMPKVDARLISLMRQELNYEVNVRGAR